MKHGLGSLIALLSAMAGGPLAANDTIDLDRNTPVAASEQIPVADFFRPPFLTNPRINPAGTHVAAVITTGEDKNHGPPL